MSRQLKAALATIFLIATLPALAQVVPSATQGGLPLVVGAGYSGFNIDWGQDAFGQVRYMEGMTYWVDWNLTHLPGPDFLKGLGVELEAINMRQITGLGGVIYTVRRFRRVHPYGKAFAGLGHINFPPLPASPSSYREDSRTITAFGAGADVHVWSHVWLRADWEYQFWPDLFGSPHNLTPTGITIGAVYDFKNGHHN